MLGMVKKMAPIVIYVIAWILCLRALGGKNKMALLFIIAMTPLRNVIERLQIYPLGRDLLDVMLVAVLIGWILQSANQGKKAAGGSPIYIFALLMIGYTFFSTIYGSFYLGTRDIFSFADPRVQSWKNLVTMPLIFFLTFNTMTERKWIWRTVMVMCLSMFLMDAYLMRQIAWFSSIVSRTKIKGTFVYLGPNEIAAFYNQFTVLLGSLFLFTRNKLWKIGLFWLILMNLYCVMFLFSRAAYIGLAVGLFLLFLIKDKKLLVLLIVVIIGWQTALPDKVQERINMTTDNFGELDKSSRHRILLWENSIDYFQKNPVFGVGYGTFPSLHYGLKDAHNIYLEILVEQGLLGMVVFLLLLLCLFTQGLRLYARGDDENAKGLGLGFALCIIVLMVNNFFGDRWTYPEVNTFLWAFAGLVARLIVDSSKFVPVRKKGDHVKTPRSVQKNPGRSKGLA